MTRVISVKKALNKVLEEMKAMSPEEFRKKLDEHKGGELAIALEETAKFLAQPETQEAMRQAQEEMKNGKN